MAWRQDSGIDSVPTREGVFVVVDPIEGICLETKQGLRHAVSLGLQPVLVMKNVDRCFLDLKLEGEEVYQIFSRIIQEANTIIIQYKNELNEDVEVNTHEPIEDDEVSPIEGERIEDVNPVEGTVIFLAGTWGFTLQDFADIYKSRYGLDPSVMIKRLWGDNFYDPSTKKWTTSPTGCATCQRGFVRLIYHSIKKVVDNSLQDEKEKLRRMMLKLGHADTILGSVKGEKLFNSVMKIWLPAGRICMLFGEGEREDRGDGGNRPQQQQAPTYRRKQQGEREDRGDGGNRPQQQQAPTYRRKQQEGEEINDGGWQNEGEHKNGGRQQQVHGKTEPTRFCLMPSGSAKRRFKLPPEVLERLAQYQIDAVRWLWGLYCESKGGILADDMGMGKTRTVCSYLRGLLDCSLIKRAIVVAPKTVLSQWEVELQRVGLADQINMYRKPLTQGESLYNVITRGGVLLTTYEVFRSKHKLITCEDTKVLQWDCIFLDEGHRIKNAETQTSKAFSKLKCRHKIVMTGTPFQNTLEELYVLVEFCCPNLLGNEQDFVEKFVKPIERAKYADSDLGHKRLSKSASEILKELLKPYMLRRTKRLLQRMGLLGNKHEMTVWLEMTTDQQNLYKALFRKVKLGKLKGASFAQASVAKNICNHPSILQTVNSHDSRSSLEVQGLASNYKKQLLKLVSFPETIIETSCKIMFILYLVEQLLQEKHKILIFSQSVPMLKLVKEALLDSMDKDKVIHMDGSTPQLERDEKIKEFQANVEDPENISPDDVPDVFLMTTSVGGMGLNLTAASRVIIIDPSQNPSLDNQSVDRAFRLGQKKEVIVYRLITSNTIEEHTYRQQVLKGEVSTSVTEEKQCARVLEKEKGKVLRVHEDGFDMSLTRDEILDHYYTGFDKDILQHVKFVEGHENVVGVNNHSLLFSIEESLPWLCEDESPLVDIGRSLRKRIPCDHVIGGDKQSYAVNDNRWGVQNKMFTGDSVDRYNELKPSPYGLAVPGRSSRHEAHKVHEQRATQMAAGGSRREAGSVHEQSAPRGSSRREAGRALEGRALQMAAGGSRREAGSVHEQSAPRGSSRREAGRALEEGRALQMAAGGSRREAGWVHERRAPQMNRGTRSGDNTAEEPDAPTGPG